ncbi:MAG: carbohydrate ABC transporter permease [Eubacteriales bacterium]|nr:carbohydrate ABC transporter permease [Eubacteriales bacterium]
MFKPHQKNNLHPITPWQIIIKIFLIVYALLILYPLIWMLMSSVKPYEQIYRSPWSLPEKWLFENYSQAWNRGIAQYFFYSVIVTAVSVLGITVTSSLAAYGLSRFKSRIVDLVLLIIICGMMVNAQVCLVPIFRMLNAFHLLDTRWALILPYICFRVPLTTLLLRSYFLSISKDISESAILDGCNEFQVYALFYVPMSRPIMMTVVLLSSYYAWNEFLFANIFISSEAKKTIPSGLMNFRDALKTDWGTLLAGMVIASLPMIILLMVFQKYLVRGMSEGAVKG